MNPLIRKSSAWIAALAIASACGHSTTDRASGTGGGAGDQGAGAVGSGGSGGAPGGSGGGGTGGGGAGSGGTGGEVSLPVCDHHIPPPNGEPTCREQGDCEDTLNATFFCVPPDAPASCGPCSPSMRECENDTECGEGRLCIEIPEPCSCTQEDSSRCVDACTADSCAGESERCNAGTGFCEPIPCHEAGGVTCPQNESCGAPGEGSMTTGCVTRPCEKDTDCECGVCMNDYCRSGPWYCQEQMQ